MISSSAVGKKCSKYGNRKVTKNGETFDSVKEYERHLVLLDMQRQGEIEDLKRQPRFSLEVAGEKIGTYVGDWSYLAVRAVTGNLGLSRLSFRQLICEDAKGFQTPEFKLKWKLVRTLYPHIDFRLS